MFWFADLRREFATPPYSSQIQVGGQAELRCHPPRGEPPARVDHWLKDGLVIDPASDSNFIQSHAGHLLILQARMADTANYTCVATNDALVRKSPAATLTVYGKKEFNAKDYFSSSKKKSPKTDHVLKAINYPRQFLRLETVNFNLKQAVLWKKMLPSSPSQ